MPADIPGGRVSGRKRVSAGITQAITDGVYSPGEKLPSIERLADQYETGQTTVKSALAILRDRGTIRSHPGKGTFVPEVLGATGCEPEPHAGGPTPQG